MKKEKINKEEKNKFKLSKSQLFVKVIAFIMAILMLMSVCTTVIYYFWNYIGK